MRNTIWRVAVVAVLALQALPGFAAEPSLCAVDETTWFNAQVEGGETFVSVCGAPKTKNGVAWLQFRKGTPDALDLAWPEERARSPEAFTTRRYTRPRTTYFKFHFEIDGKEHAILEWHVPDETPSHGLEFRIRGSDREIVLLEEPLKSTSDPLTLMRLEGHVLSAPFDE